MSKRTPGPWGIEQTDDTNWIGFMRPHDPKKVELIVCTTSRESLTDEALARNDANARLIAAAPDLLATWKLGVELDVPAFLEWIADRMEHVHGENPLYDYMHHLRDIAKAGRAAIAKATGK